MLVSSENNGEGRAGRRVSRRGVVAAMAGASTLAVFGAPAAAVGGAGDVVLADEGSAHAVIVWPTGADQQVINAARDISVFVEASTGVRLAAVREGSIEDDGRVPVRILVGDFPNEPVMQGLEGLGSDGYVIAIDTGAVRICGPTNWGTRFGVYEFLERFVGVRWLLPASVASDVLTGAAIGDDVPRRAGLAVPRTLVRHTPSFQMRSQAPYSVHVGDGSRSPDHALRWGAYLRCHRPIVAYGHTLWSLVPVEKYGDRPELYPLRDGRHVVPKPGVKTGWQPRFSADELPEVVAAEILAQLAVAPADTVSLGVNDGAGFSEDDLAGVDGFGNQSASAAYYRFVNRVASLVTEKHPDVIIGLLAYDNVVEPPQFTLHPNVAIFLTWDRSGWRFAKTRTRDQDLTTRWLEVCKRVGWYDYRYGWRYAAPRIDTASVVDAYRWAHQAGVQYCTGETYGNPAEGSKPWVFSRLMWDINADPVRLRREWCERAVGRRAAPALVAFEELWESVWETDVSTTGWFKSGAESTMYQYVDDPDYLAAIDVSAVQRARTLLDLVRARADTPHQRARAELINRVFAFHEASILSYPRPVPVPSTLAAAQALLNQVVAELDQNIALADSREQIVRELQSEPSVEMRGLLKPIETWSGWNAYPAWALVDYLRSGDPAAHTLRARLHQVRSSPSAALQKFAGIVLAGDSGHVIDLGVNTSFDESSTEGWLIETLLPPREEIRQDTETVFSTGKSLRIPLGFKYGGVSQLIDVRPGSILRTTMKFFTHTSADADDATLRPTWYLYNAAGAVVGVVPGINRYLADTSGYWTDLEMTGLIPDGVVKVRAYASFKKNIRAAGAAYLDEARFQMLHEVSI